MPNKCAQALTELVSRKRTGGASVSEAELDKVASTYAVDKAKVDAYVKRSRPNVGKRKRGEQTGGCKDVDKYIGKGDVGTNGGNGAKATRSRGCNISDVLKQQLTSLTRGEPSSASSVVRLQHKALHLSIVF